jgi:Lyase
VRRAREKAKPVSRAALAGEADPRLVALSVSIQDDAALFREDIRGSQAHVTMLAAQRIVPRAAARRIVAGLDQVRREFEQGKIRFDPALEDVHTHVERRLGELVGKDAGYLHAGRSRNDQVALDELAQAPLHVGVHVLEGRVEADLPLLELAADPVQGRGDAARGGARDDAAGGEHRHVGLAPANVLPEERRVVLYRDRERDEARIGLAGERRARDRLRPLPRPPALHG